MADDDSEPILGHWFEETLSPSELPDVSMHSPSGGTGANDADGVGNKNAQHHSSADSICAIADKKEPDAVCMLCYCSLKLKICAYYTCPIYLACMQTRALDIISRDSTEVNSIMTE